MSANGTQFAKLISRDGSKCHYCNIQTKPGGHSGKGGKQRRTRDHVVPKSLGGSGSVYNFVLACAGCNSMRGNELVYCYCDFCVKVVDDWYNDALWCMANPSRYRIFKDNGKWIVLFNFKRFHHGTHIGAMKSMRGISKMYIHDKEARDASR